MRYSYSIDAGIVIDLHKLYPQDIFSRLWTNLDMLIADGRASMPRACLDELDQVDDGCHAWAKSCDGFVSPASDEEVALVAIIANAHPGWVRLKKNAADPWLIAHASTTARYVVTGERAKGNVPDPGLRIPDVAAEHGIDCVNVRDFFRLEGWRF